MGQDNPASVTETNPPSEQDTNMFLTEKLMAAQREAAERVRQGKSYSVALPIVGRVPVPSPEQLAIYAALGGLAVLEVIDWPVALAMGVGSAVVSRRLTDLKEREEELAEAIEPPPAVSPDAAPAGTKAVQKAAPTKTPAKKVPAKKTPAKKAPAKKTPAKKAPAKRNPAP